MGILAAVDEGKKASGFLFWDDGETLDTLETGNYLGIQFNISFLVKI